MTTYQEITYNLVMKEHKTNRKVLNKWYNTNSYHLGVSIRHILSKEGFKRVPRLQPSQKAKTTDLYKFIIKNALYLFRCNYLKGGF